MDKKEVLNKYGEYGVPFSVASKLDCYEVRYSMELKDIRKMLVDCKENGDSDLLSNCNTPIVMTFGNVDLEFTYYEVTEKGLDTGFFCCAKYAQDSSSEKDGWQSEGFVDIETTLELFDDIKKLEEIMYKSLIDYIKKKKLIWSKLNLV